MPLSPGLTGEYEEKISAHYHVCVLSHLVIIVALCNNRRFNEIQYSLFMVINTNQVISVYMSEAIPRR